MFSALKFFDGERYALEAAVAMDDHAHAVLIPHPDHKLEEILHSWKSFTSKWLIRISGRYSPVWQEEYFDRYVRHDRQYVAARHYIEENPVKAGLVSSPREWPFGSARLRLRNGAAG